MGILGALGLNFGANFLNFGVNLVEFLVNLMFLECFQRIFGVNLANFRHCERF